MNNVKIELELLPKIEKTLINNIDRKIEKIDTSDEIKSVFRKRRECACSRIDEETKTLFCLE